VHIVVPVPPGGSTDLLARVLAAGLEARLGQAFVVESRPGANGTVAAGYVKSAEPNGYTVLFYSAPLIHPLFNKAGGVVLGKDLAPVSQSFRVPTLWYVRSNLPVHSLQELVAYSKANPGKLNFGSPGALNDVVMQYLRDRSGLDYVSIPYKGQAPATTSLLSGDIDITSGATAPMVPLIQSGKIRPIFGTLPSSSVPGVPTLVSLGFPMEGAVTSFGLMAPMNTPRNVIASLADGSGAVLKAADMVTRVRKEYDAEAVGSTPEEQMRSFTTDLDFWTEAVRIANYKPE
jgi:tripartite-type tricarboxylate transporter receptor subunit TctC